jgi:hypothetical protein
MLPQQALVILQLRVRLLLILEPPGQHFSNCGCDSMLQGHQPTLRLEAFDNNGTGVLLAHFYPALGESSDAIERDCHIVLHGEANFGEALLELGYQLQLFPFPNWVGRRRPHSQTSEGTRLLKEKPVPCINTNMNLFARDDFWTKWLRVSFENKQS